MGTHAKATASSKHVEFDLTGMDGGDDERDPLGILGGPSSGHDHRVDTYTAASPSAAAAVASLGPEVSMRSPMVRAPTIRVDRERRDPCEAIDAILRSSKDVRDRISSRQARVFEAYKVENHKLNKELAHLPATYDQYLAVREKAKSRRRQRSIVNTEELISHPLEFHLCNAESLSRNAGRSSVVEYEQTTEVMRAANGSDLEAEASRRTEEEESNSNSGSDNDLSPTYLKGDGGPVEQKGAHESAEQAAFRRSSTRARAGSAAEKFTARQQFTCCHQEERRQHSWKPRESPSKEEVPALRQSKIRGRYMVFSLLAAARDEEEEMEKRLIASKEAVSAEEQKEREELFRKLDEARSRNAKKLDALMTEYNPRPSRSRRDNTLEKLRVALPVPSVSEDDSRFGADGDGYDNDTHDAQSERREEGERESLSYNARSGDGCAGDVSDGDHRDRLEGGPLASADDIDGVDRCGGVSVSETIEHHHESYGSDPQECQPSEPLEGSEGGAVGVSDGDGIVGTLTNPPNSSVDKRPTVAEDGKDKNGAGGSGRQGNGGRTATEELRKRPATSQRKVPTLPDPNEVNSSVMADPFNMDHLKDLPGLTGGCSRGLSALVSEAVTYTDPAFPNLEFHRRAAMDRAGYFMPGYKPRVISPGPDAGAYWLERRQSYRVKMAAPPHEQKHPQRQRGALNTAPPPAAACLQAIAHQHHSDATGRPTPNTSKR